MCRVFSCVVGRGCLLNAGGCEGTQNAGGCKGVQRTGACNGVQSAAERSYPMSVVRGRSQDNPVPEGRWQRGVTPCLRSGAAAESARLQRCRNSQEELPHVRGQGQRPIVAGCDGAGTAERSYPASEVRGDGREEPPCAQGQGRRPGETTTLPRSGGCLGAGGPRGAIPR